MIKTKTVETTLGGLVEDGYGIIEGLAESCRESFDNLPENLQNTSRNQTLGQAADDLENVSNADVPDGLADIKMSVEQSYETTKKGASRSVQRDFAVTMLGHAKDRVDEEIAILEAEEDDDESEEDDESPNREKIDQYEAFSEELQTMIDEAESVEFPGGMMG